MTVAECKDCRLGPCKEDSRRCDGLDEQLEELSEGVKTDFYKGKGVVSMESACQEEQRLKAAIDDSIQAENRYASAPGRVGRTTNAPCRVARRLWTG